MASSLSAGVSQALQVYINGTKAWFEDSQEAWTSATVVSKEETPTGVKILFENDNDNGRQHVFESTFTLLEKQKGANLPPLKNPPRQESIDDLTNLTYLNEPSVLDTIRARYLERHIYTYSGIVLIAANPFARVPLYEPQVIQQYSGKRRGELDPHLFAIAEDAYRFMIREKMNQTVVVSGESGAGKTVSATHIMRYFATADDQESGKVKDTSKGMTEVEEQIMATNPIMEAFGNAKTTRNNNSSRFGKYIEIQFDALNNIVGAKIRTYLLERSRLNFQPETERNYHIFYQLCEGSLADEKKRLGLGDWSTFHYLNQSGVGSIPGVNDAAEFKLTKESLSLVGISSEQQGQIFQLLAALLHIGNIEVGGRTDASIADNDAALITTTQLLGISKTAEFKKWLTRRQIITRSDKIVKNLSIVQSLVVRDSVAKYIYASLFDWLVKVVNDSLSCQEEGKVRTFIGVLDIYGFEHFKKNSFEQFCINYANEKLQQQFNQHVFKLEQEEYIKEKIEWKFIEFSDNQKCIEVIEAKLGILSLLDEESRMPSGTDQGFCNKLFSNFSDPKYKNYFKKPRFSNSAFTVCHYAHEVEYDSEGFIDKNKDTVPDELLNLLQTADSPFLVDMLQTATAAAAATSQESKPTPVKRVGMAVAKKPTLGSIFKLSLISLMDTINKTNVHYIRCIKPNEAKVAWGFEANMVLSQLRACGVLETIRISCAGYPSRWSFPEFAERFYALVHSKHWDPKFKPDVNELCSLILKENIKEKDKYQIGLTKIFFRAGQLAHLEKCRRERWDECTILFQKNAKRYIARTRYLKTLDLVSLLQRVGRQKLGVRKLEIARQTKAVVKIQTEWRRFIQRKRYVRQCIFIVQFQTACRTRLMHHKFEHIRQHSAAIRIQRLLRGWVVRKRFLAKRNHAVRLQQCIRRRQARQRLIQLREFAKASLQEKKSNQTIHQAPRQAPQQAPRQVPQQAPQQIPQQALKEERYQSMEIETQMSSFTNNDAQDKKEMMYMDNRSRSQTARPEIVNHSSTDEIAGIKSEILRLKSQISYTLDNYPKRLPSPRTNPRRRSGMKSESFGKKIVFAQPEQMTAQKLGSLTAERQNPEAALIQLIQTSIQPLENEIVEGLIHTLRIVPPGTSAREHVFFPAHMIGQCVSHLWRLGFLSESERLLSRVIRTIKQECASFRTEDVLVPYAYWISNTHELLSLICSTEQELERDMHFTQGRSISGWHDLEKLIGSMKYELQCLQDGIYYHGITELKKVLDKMVVPAVVESQTRPGFTVSDSSRLFGKVAASYSMEDLLNFINRVYRTMKGYYVDSFVIEQAISELFRLIDVKAFDDLIMRHGFNSWKRGKRPLDKKKNNKESVATQIENNVSQLEEWCKNNNMRSVIYHLEHLIQAFKLLQLSKRTQKDIDAIYNQCWSLNPSQIQKLIQSYHAAGYEDPISNEILRFLASRVSSGDTGNVLLCDQISLEENDYDQPEPYPVDICPYIPSYLNIKHVQKFITLTHLLERR